jgi:hypothetical protein
VAQFREDEHFPLHDSDSVVGADLRTAPAEGAFVVVHLRDEDAHLLPVFDGGIEKEVGVGLLHVAI